VPSGSATGRGKRTRTARWESDHTAGLKTLLSAEMRRKFIGERVSYEKAGGKDDGWNQRMQKPLEGKG